MKMLMVVCVAAVALTGCAAGGGVAVEQPVQSTVPDVARRYVDALAARQFEAVQTMGELAVPASPAASYAAVQLGLVRAADDSGLPPLDSLQVVPEGDALRVCEAADAIESCFSFAGFELDGDRLARFTLDGVPVEELVRGAPAPVEVPGARLEVLGSYRSAQSGLLNVVVAVTASTAGLRLVPERAAHTGPDGRRQEAVGFASAEGDLPAGATRTVSLAFSDAQPGGTLELVLIGPSGESATSVALG